MTAKPLPILERDAGYPTPCYEWTGARTGRKPGYSVIRIEGILIRICRLVWTAANGPIPPGYEVCHRCNNTPCIRLDHLYLGLHQENMADAGRDGLLGAKRPARGTAHGRAKLDEAQVAYIRQSRESQRWLAEYFGVSQRTIWNVIHRKVWT